jgi:predicted anti-sigma-YlaC factor YlaD
MDLDSLTCQELVELVNDYIEGLLPSEEQARFELHLQGCSGCRAYLQQMKQTIDLTGRLRDDELLSPAREDLLDVFRKWKQAK